MLTYQGSLFGTGTPELCGRKLIERKYLDDVTWIDRASGWLSGADELLVDLAASLPWRASRRPMFGRLVDEPRLTAGFVNYYRNGSDSVAWHADRVGVHQSDPIVAIVSLGGPRTRLRRA